MRNLKKALTAGLLVITGGVPLCAAAQSQVSIAFSYPLTGSLSTVGNDLHATAELAVNIINEQHPNLSNIPLAKTAGLPNLDGAKIKPVFIDTQGDPATGQTQLLRFASQNSGVAAIVGSYQSAVTKTTSNVGERYGIPFVAADAVEADLTRRGYKWFFRTTPDVSYFAKDYARFLNDVNKNQDANLKTVAIVHENSSYGSSVSKWVKKAVQDGGFEVVSVLTYGHNTTDVSSEVTKLRNVDPDVVVFASYTSDAILYMRTMKNLGYKPKLIIGDDSGFSDPSFAKNVGSISRGVLNRSAWSLPDEGAGHIANEMYHEKTGDDLDGSTARALQGILALAEAINRAGSTDHDAIRKALAKTNLSSEQIIMPWQGIKFDDTHQNTLGGVVLVQLQDKQYTTVWPQKYADSELIFPYVGWQK